MTGFHLGYGTNGFTNHRLDDALGVIADLGYTAVALTLDHAHLDPFGTDVSVQVRRVAARLSTLGLRVVVETGARYLLDPLRKHHPTLVSEDPDARVAFLHRAVQIAAELDADCVSFWSGVRPPTTDPRTAWQSLVRGVEAVLVQAGRYGVRLGIEPEPGMLIEHLSDALRLRDELGAPELLGITLDVGHCVAVEPFDPATGIRMVAALLVNVQLDSMRRGVHEHLEFDDGELDLAATLAALDEAGYTGVAAVELPRHSHAAPAVARRSMAALRAALPRPRPGPAADDPWLATAERRVREDPGTIRVAFPAVGRNTSRSPLMPEPDPTGVAYGTVDDSARARLLVALAEVVESARLASELTDLYRYGDDAERRGVLRGLSALPDRVSATVTGVGLDIVRQALRANDTRLIAAAVGRFAARHLDQHAWRHAVLKCMFVGVPLVAVAGLARRTDGELLRMVADYVTERRAAGRDVPADVEQFLAVLAESESRPCEYSTPIST